jgi:hypothetical protein
VKAVPHILSPAVRLGDTLYLSGQTPIDATGKVVDGGIEEMTEYVQRLSAHSSASELQTVHPKPGEGSSPQWGETGRCGQGRQ